MKNKPFFGSHSIYDRNKEAVASEVFTHLLPTTAVLTQPLLPIVLPHLREGSKGRKRRRVSHSRLRARLQENSLLYQWNVKMHHFLLLQQLLANILIKASLMCPQNYSDNPSDHLCDFSFVKYKSQPYSI